jgi:DME family drug/metabolite transporter
MHPTENSRPKSTGAFRSELMVIASALLFGTSGTVMAFAPVGAVPAIIGTLRLVVGGPFLLVITLINRRSVSCWRLPVLPLLCAAGGTAIFQLCFFEAIARTGVAVGTIVSIGSTPVIAGIIGWMVRGEHLGGRWALSTALAVGGCCLLSGFGGDLSIDFIGILFALGAAVAFAVFQVANKNMISGDNADVVMASVLSLGAVFLLPRLVFADLSWIITVPGTALALYLGIIATAVPNLLFARGLSVLPVSRASTLGLAEPLIAGLLGILFLGERLGIAGIVGIALIFSGLTLLTVFPEKQPVIAVDSRFLLRPAALKE